jgi:Mg-chelatase subunit ChlD
MAESRAAVERIALSAVAEYVSYPPASQQVCWATTSLKAPFYEPTSRSPVDIVAVIDKSGSMRGGKLELVKKTLLFVVDQLKECDRLSLVTYDTQVYVDFGLTAMDRSSKDRTKAMISKLEQGSCTNLCGGLVKGMEQIAFCTGEHAQVQSVLLLTDGLANEGIKGKDNILAEMMKLQSPPAMGGVAQKSFDGTVYTFGFGSDHDSSLLEAISSQGGGVYYFIDTTEKIPESFADCLGGLLSVVGQNLVLKMEAVGGNTMSAIHGNRTVHWTTANKSCEIQLGDIQSEEERDIVLELCLPPVEGNQGGTVLSVSLSYFNVITSTLVDTGLTELVITRSDDERGPPNMTVDQQRNRIIATEALKNSEPLAALGRMDEAKKMLQDAVSTLEKSPTAASEYCKALLEDLKRSLAGMKSRDDFKKYGQQYMHSK